MIHPDTALRFISDDIGYGVVATKAIPKGTIVWVGDPLDQRIPVAQVAELGPLFAGTIDKYAWLDTQDVYILCWDISRYVNHSCDASSLSVGTFDFTMAVRDIEAGEEITDDYGTLNLTETFTCACGSPKCRKDVGPDDPSRMTTTWDAIVREALPSAANVAQPLMSLLSAADREGLERELRDPKRLPSIADQFRPPARRVG